MFDRAAHERPSPPRENALTILVDGDRYAIDGDRLAVLAWDWQQPVQDVSNRPFYTRKVVAVPSRPLSLSLVSLPEGKYRLQVRRMTWAG